MGKLQIIFVIETSNDDKSDSLYLRAILDYYFLYENDIYDGEVATQTICLNGKQHYNDKKIVNRIVNQTKMFASQNPSSTTKVIYILDIDSTAKAFKQGSFFYNVIEFCNSNGFELVWYCKNAENVFLGQEADKIENKTEAAISFVRNDNIRKIKKINLSKIDIEYKCSNILNIIGKYLKQKQK